MDLVSPVRVVIVDDDPMHLFSIANGLTLSGIPCVWHWYDKVEAKLVPSPPAGGYPHLRLVFTDLNIREMTGAGKEAKSLASTLISEVLQPIVPHDGGPYSVVLWTSVGGLAEEVKPIIMERINAQQLDELDRRPQPLSIETFEKANFVVSSANTEEANALTKMFNASNKNAEVFKSSIQKVVSNNIQLRLISGWETRLSLSASATMKSMHKIAVNESNASNISLSDAVGNLFAKIAIQAVGEKNATENPMLALDVGLIDLAVDELTTNSYLPDYSEVVKTALLEAIKTKPTITPKTISQLNTSLHVEIPANVTEIVARGAVFSVDTATITELTGRDDKKLLEEEFMPDGRSDALFNASRVLLIEIGADCDHAQRKPRTIRFLCAAEIPFKELSEKQKKDLRKLELRHDALVALGPWVIGNEDKVVLVSVRRFVTWQDWSSPEKLKIEYRLRKPIVDLVLYKYTTHSNRPGIISLN